MSLSLLDFAPVTHVEHEDGVSYKIYPIGMQRWLEKNIYYSGESDNIGECNAPAEDPNCEISGRVYTWADAMGLDDECNTHDCEHRLPMQGICPDGFHVPSSSEWDVLMNYLGSTIAGKVLMAKEGSIWKLAGDPTEGWGSYNFNAQPGCYAGACSGQYAYFWSATEDRNSYEHATYYDIYSGNNDLNKSTIGKTTKYSVRCIGD